LTFRYAVLDVVLTASAEINLGKTGDRLVPSMCVVLNEVARFPQPMREVVWWATADDNVGAMLGCG